MKIQTLSNDAKVKCVTYRPKVEAICSVAHDPFRAQFEIEYWPQDVLLEYISFEEWLAEASTSKEMLVEDLARLVFDKLKAVLGDVDLTVKVSATTESHAPITVQVSW